MRKSSSAVLSAAAVAGIALSAPASAQVTSVNGKIAYAVCEYVWGEQTCDIWVMNADGSEQTNLTNTPEINETAPAWSPDGTRIAFVEGVGGLNRLMMMKADGTERAAITEEPSLQFGPTWSPGGTQIAFVRQVPGQEITIQFDILVINVDGTGEVNITSSDYDELEPSWSPDGAKIAFAAVRPEWSQDPDTGEPVLYAQWEIVAVNPDGTGEQILSAGDTGTPRALLLEEDRSPAWSPDSRMLVFMSQSVDPCCTPWQIWKVNRDGTGAAVLSDNPEVNDLWPAFSPDGTLIVFTSDRDATAGGELDVYTMPAPPSPPAAANPETAASVTRLTTSGNSSHPSWGRKPGTGPFTLSILRDPQTPAAGGVASYPAGILCGRDCSETYAPGTVVLLFAIPRAGSSFTGWSGACSGTKPYCVVTMNEAKSVGVGFERARN